MGKSKAEQSEVSSRDTINKDTHHSQGEPESYKYFRGDSGEESLPRDSPGKQLGFGFHNHGTLFVYQE